MNRKGNCSWIVFCNVYSVLLYLPEPLQIEAPGIKGYIASYCFNYLFCLSLSAIICLFGFTGASLRNWISKVWHLIWHIIFIVYAVSHVFLISVFNLRWNAFTLQLLKETNNQEVTGFFASYINCWQTYVLVLFIFILLLIECLALRWIADKDTKSLERKIRASLLILALSFAVAEARCFSTNQHYNYEHSDKLIRRLGLWNTYQSILQYDTDADNLNSCILSQQNIRIDSISYRSKNIVLIIGETHNKYHSSLYGYGLNTNPRLAELGKQLYVFDNVISPVNATTASFQYFLSFASTDNGIRWNQTPLFPALFKEAGYNVVFYSNQYVSEGNLDYYDASAGFFNHPAIYSKLFSMRNHRKHAFDVDMVEEFANNRSRLEADSLNLIMFHLHGQHSPAVERYPLEFSYFTAKDINRCDLKETQKEEIAQYDNATLYNDYVIRRIIDLYKEQEAIIIYFADHSEEVYDFRPKAGRFYDFKEAGFECLKYQLGIPMYIYPTEKYKETHADVIEALNVSCTRPFMTDDIPHVILGLAGINTTWYDSSRDILSKDYNSCRERIVAGGYNYDLECR